MIPLRKFALVVVSLLLVIGGGARSVAAEKFSQVQLVEEIPLNFPPTAEAHGIFSGEVHVVMQIGEDGRVADWLLLGSTDEAFDDEVARVLPQWRFSPVLADGKPLAVRMEVSFWFSKTGVITALVDENHMWWEKERYWSRVCPLRDLDRAPQLRYSVSPRLPAGARLSGGQTTVTVDYYIDETGRVRMPAAEKGDNSLLAPTIAAVRQWQFDPPTRKGQPVVIHATQDFIFRQ